MFKHKHKILYYLAALSQSQSPSIITESCEGCTESLSGNIRKIYTVSLVDDGGYLIFLPLKTFAVNCATVEAICLPAL